MLIRKDSKIQTPVRILLIRLSSIGDIILTTPLIRLLQQRFPGAELDFVIKKRFTDLVKANPHLNHIYAYDESLGFADLARIRRAIRQRRYEVVLDLHKNLKSLFLTAGLTGCRLWRLQKFGLKRFLLVYLKWNWYREIVPVYRRYIDTAASLQVRDDGLGPEFFLASETKAQVLRLLSAENLAPGRPAIAIAPGAGFFTKRWLPDRFARVAHDLQRNLGAQILIIGGTQDQSWATEIKNQLNGPVLNLAGRLSLMETACVLAQCDLLIANDSGMMHLASALGIKVVAIFGATVAEFGFFPFAAQSRVLQRPLRCRPCSHIGSHKCPQGHFRCMKEIQTDQVYQAVMELMTDTVSPTKSHG